MQITRNVGERAARMIRLYETPERAAHECRVQLTALAGYRDRELERVLSALDYVCKWEGERRNILLTQLSNLIKESEVEPCKP